MVNIFEKIANLQIWQQLILSMLLGSFTTIALAPFHFMPVVFVTIPTFLALLVNCKKYHMAFLLGTCFGFGYFLAGLWWIANSLLVEINIFAWLVPFAVLGIPLFLALYWGLAALLAKMFFSNNNMQIIAFAFCFALAEYMRAKLFGGFAWNIFGITFAPHVIFMQIVNIIGLSGLTFFAFFISATPLALAQKNNKKFLPLVAIILLFGQILYGLATIKNYGFENINLKIVQPNIAQQDKLNPQKTAEIIDSYIQLSENDGVDYLIWPESAFPFLLQQNSQTLLAIDNLLTNNTNLITGAVRAEYPDKIFNSIFVLNDKAEIIAISDKEKLVPFGEFLPFRNLLEIIGLRTISQQQGDFSIGKKQIIQIRNDPPFLPLICYEIIFSNKLNNNKQAKWIVNLTNDAWFGNSTGPYQHSHHAILRGVELGLPVVRVANTGISFISDANGKIVNKINLNIQDVLLAKLPIAKKATFYAQYNDIIFYLSTCIVGFILLIYKIGGLTNKGRKLWLN